MTCQKTALSVLLFLAPAMPLTAQESLDFTPEEVGAEEALEFTAEEVGAEAGLEFTPEEVGAEAGLEFTPEEVGAEEALEFTAEEVGAEEALEFTAEEVGAEAGLEFTPEEVGAEEDLEFAPEGAAELDPATADGVLFNGCDIAPSDYLTVVEEALLGTWNAQQNGGVAAAAGIGIVRVPPQGQVDSFTFGGVAGALTLSSSQFGPLPVHVVQGSEVSDYGFEQDDGSHLVMDFTTDTAPNCDFALLPVVRASGSVTGPGGGPGHAEAYLHFLDEDTLAGIWSVTGLAEGGTQVHYRVFISVWR